MSNLRPCVIKPEQPDFAKPTLDSWNQRAYIVIGENMWSLPGVDSFETRMEKRQSKLQTICFINSDKIDLIKNPTSWLKKTPDFALVFKKLFSDLTFLFVYIHMDSGLLFKIQIWFCSVQFK